MYSAVPPRCDTVRPGHLFRFGLATALVLCGALMLYAFKPGERGIYPMCVFHRLTGWLCPGCGGLRAVHYLLHARILEAFHCNPLLFLLLPAALWRGADSTMRSLRGLPAPKPIAPAWIWAGLAAALGFTVLRNIDISQLAWMRP